MTFITKADGSLSFNDLNKLSQVRLCSGRPQQCRVLDVNDIKGEFEALIEDLIENKKVTATFGDAITLEASVQVSTYVKNFIDQVLFAHYL